jgi:hypothetical protein
MAGSQPSYFAGGVMFGKKDENGPGREVLEEIIDLCREAMGSKLHDKMNPKQDTGSGVAPPDSSPTEDEDEDEDSKNALRKFYEEN